MTPLNRARVKPVMTVDDTPAGVDEQTSQQKIEDRVAAQTLTEVKSRAELIRDRASEIEEADDLDELKQTLRDLRVDLEVTEKLAEAIER